MTEAERAWLEAHPDIVLGYTDAFEPEVIVDPDGSLRGIQVDILAELNRRLGTRIRLQIDSVSTLVEKAQKREVDGILSLHPEYADELGLLKTGSYFTGYPTVFARKDVGFNSLSDLTGKRVAVIDKVFFSRQIIEQYGQKSTVLKVQNAEEAFRLVDKGQADYFLGASLNEYLIAKYQLFNLTAQYVFYDHPIYAVIGTRSDWPEFVSILNKGLSSFSKETIETIVSKWSGTSGITPGYIVEWVLIISGVAVAIVLLFIFWNWQLHRRVNARTSELAESESRFRATFEQAAVGIAHVALDGRFIRINQKFCDIVGYSHSELLDLTFQDITYSDDLDADIEHINQLLSGKSNTYAMEKRYIPKNGELVWVHLTVSLVRNEAGQPQWFVYVVKDITERKQAEIQVFEMASFAELNPAPVLRVNPDGIIMSCNPAAVEILGKNAKKGTSISFILPDLSKIDMDKCIHGNMLLSQEVDIKGRFYLLILRGVSDLSLVYIYGSDITERKQAENKLLESEEQFRNMMEQSPISIQISNPDGSLNEVNPAFLKLWGFSEEDLPGLFEKYNVLQDEQARKLGVMPLIEKAFKGEAVILPPIEYDAVETMKAFHFTKPRGKKRWIQNRLYPVKNKKGEIMSVVLVEEDITEHREAEKEIQRLRDEYTHIARVTAMGELAASLAHELKQPLAAIRSNAQAAQRFLTGDKPDIDELREILTDIIEDDRRADNVIGRLRALMKKGEIQTAELNINDVVRDILPLISSYEIVKNISLKLELDEKIPLIAGDRIQLQQVILNLILNSTEALTGSKIDSRIIYLQTNQVNGQNVQVSIKDNGPGIKKEAIDHLFEPFYTTKKEGLGMGLAISRSIIEEHGGRLWAENNSDGGATFYFTIPVFKGDSA